LTRGRTLVDATPLWVVVAALFTPVLGLCGLSSQLLRQHARILRRLESLEQRNGSATVGQRAGALPVGAPFPSFRLPDVTGRTTALADLAGRRALVVNWSPSCGFCDRIAPELASLRPRLDGHNVELVLLASGNVDANRALAERHHLAARLLLTDGSPPVAPFVAAGTPVAYLLDERGSVARSLAVGANEVIDVAREISANGRTPLPTQRPLSESRIERSGLAPGSRAPRFTLEDIHGRPVSLDDFAGQRVLLVFSDPHCGPCNELTPHLVRIQREQQANARIVMVSRGDRDENRRKAERHGVTFPVLLQPGWKVSREYGIFATPVAFLIDEQGTIEKEVAVGTEQITSLLKPAHATGAPMSH
jgi:peroxiredoxin